MAMKLILLLATVQVLAQSRLVYRTSSRSGRNIPLEFQKSTDMIESSGLIAESHDVTTEDGYIIRLDRLPADQEFNANKVVVIQHGIGGATDNWLLYGKRSFPSMLRLAGYDVWMINSRGNSYSRRHVSLSDNDSSYWAFSFHEMGYYDLAASIDYALNATGADRVFLVGHSRGTSCSYILLSLRPEYNNKVKLLISMAPVAYTKHAKSPLLQPLFKQLSIPQVSHLVRKVGFSNLPGIGSDQTRQLRLALCGADKLIQPICLLPYMMFNGHDYMNNKKAYQVFLTHFPDGGSTKELLHFLQLAQRDVFAPYSYSESKNMAVYNATQPPAYPLHKITVPSVFYHADNDFIVSPQDLNRLLRQIPNVVGVFRISNPKFNHINFIFGSSSDRLLYKHAIDVMNTYTYRR